MTFDPPETEPVKDAAAQQLWELLHRAVSLGASDVHLSPGNVPLARVHGRLEALPAGPHDASPPAPLSPDVTRHMAAACLSAQTQGADGAQRLQALQDYDGSLALPAAGGGARFRFNLHRARGGWALALRSIGAAAPTLAELDFPQGLAQRLIAHPHGLVIFTGAAGVGKSSSMAAIILLLAQSRSVHVLTIEEPVEYVLRPTAGSLFTQREVGSDTPSFASGLRHGLRQDPDVILVGETRDRDTAQMVLSAAETGHLVFTTLHTRDAKGALTRFADLFPAEAQDDVRRQLAMSLRAVVSQLLLPSVDGGRRALALEVLHVNQQAEVAIRNGRVETLESVIQTGKRDGMWTLDDDLRRLLSAGRISFDTARRVARRPEELSASMGG
ncbi:MAG: PilT/PilU family type 4a pilus ATPase [Phycisphaerae bacterium]|nr:PilT/PilU family type 4a pilus ATPase [Phycisphaerae bacterium]MCZ2398777.1 PilT/PilU family type 4a pilus ATPase [Phycisphaerae bacterium]